MRTLLLAVSLALQRLVNRIGRFAAWLALALAGIILFDVVTRRFFVLGSTKLQEVEWHLHTALFMLCLVVSRRWWKLGGAGTETAWWSGSGGEVKVGG